jgi:hypothetical protein
LSTHCPHAWCRFTTTLISSQHSRIVHNSSDIVLVPDAVNSKRDLPGTES